MHSESAIAGLEAALADLRGVVGADHVRPAAAQDAIDGVVPSTFVEPANAEEMSRVLKIATAAGLHVSPRGNGSKMEWGNPPRSADLIVSTRRLNRVVEHAWADMTATVEAGCTVAQFQQTLAQHGQRVALDPLWPEQATIGGILATNDSGPLRIRFGSLRDLIIGITLALPDGTLAKSGGKVVKNVAGYDLPKLATGSLGTLGIITQAIFRLHPIFRESHTLTFSLPDRQAMSGLLLAILDSRLVPTGLQIRAGNGGGLHIDIRFEGTSTGCDAQCEQIRQMAAELESGEARNVWNDTESLWSAAPCVAKISLLPSELGAFLDNVKRFTEPLHLAWTAVVQGVGVGFLRVESESVAPLMGVLGELRQWLESRGGSLVLLRAPLKLKQEVDVWGSAGDAMPLMKNIKARFDPAGTLNPGRFIGGI
ncbi:MAG TPA: FAD-binding oxidoreductase [Terriglobales bacterium]|nr:FAD-binding oxidoreductase [Terriglobales bacterium]